MGNVRDKVAKHKVKVLGVLTDVMSSKAVSMGIIEEDKGITNEMCQYPRAEMKSSRIMIRQPQAPANGGNFFNGMPSTVTLGCGTWGGNITTENINYKHFLNVTWLSRPITPVKPTDDEMFGEYWKKFGKE